MGLKENLESRDALVQALRAEVIGPDPKGVPGSLPGRVTRKQAEGPRCDDQGQEVLTVGGGPSRRYGAGILHPAETLLPVVEPDTSGAPDVDGDESSDSSAPASRGSTPRYEPEGDDYDISSTNSFNPSALGISFVLDASRLEAGLVVEVATAWRVSRTEVSVSDCGTYRPHEVLCADEASGGQVAASSESERDRRTEDGRTWWRRIPLLDEQGHRPRLRFEQTDVLKIGSISKPVLSAAFTGLQVVLTSRSWPSAPEGHRLVTITLINRAINETGVAGGHDVRCLFQSGLVVNCPEGSLAPYPRATVPCRENEDQLSDTNVNRLLYRNRRIYAVGHGCSADWDTVQESVKARLWTDFMPTYELAPVGFDIPRPNGKSLQITMRSLSDFAPADESYFFDLRELASLYDGWLRERESQANAEGLGVTAKALLIRGRETLERILAGIEKLQSDPIVLRAFQLANKAMLMTQHRGSRASRTPEFRGEDISSWSSAYIPLDLLSSDTVAMEVRDKIGIWRPFQIAFLLMSICGIVDHDSSADRDIVDLIWFPTGGGKTEAYLGLSAFSVLYNALSGRCATEAQQARSTSILMRYSLRLLTAQQFQRAVKLFCAMELLRNDNANLGAQPFTVGLWVGGDSTPNTRERALRSLRLMRGEVSPQQGENPGRNPFVLLQCPWCAASFGQHGSHAGSRSGNGRRREITTVLGYRKVGHGATHSIGYRCEDTNCEFGSRGQLSIPALVVDEDIYESPPTLLIGTVDKFAQLAWKPEARSLFGIGTGGDRVAPAPSLIIQDELHLMTGPLGTMVGLFETVLEGLCAHDGGIQPKIVASTATAARAAEQIKALYGRSDARMFPPSGLEAGDSFFATEDLNAPGRLYVGVLSPAHGSMQTAQSRVFASLGQAAADIAFATDEDVANVVADPWWTLLGYYNSLRELGGALTLFGADIPEYLNVLHRRNATPGSARRRIWMDRVLELTSRLKSEEIPEALVSLEKELQPFARGGDCTRTVRPSRGVIDACLASSIVEVGVDVPRLSLMSIIGQPKTTSSYIQVSSRVGRKHDRPGLVIALYSMSKPRDRSHYERFRAYHQSLYAWVEPTSVTPFSQPAVERALHAVLVALIRQLGNSELEDPRALFNASQSLLREEAVEIIVERAKRIAREDEIALVERQLQQLVSAWRVQGVADWGKAGQPDTEVPGRLYPAGSERPPSWGQRGWSTPVSLRNVDASCEAAVTECYMEDDQRNEAKEAKEAEA